MHPLMVLILLSNMGYCCMFYLSLQVSKSMFPSSFSLLLMSPFTVHFRHKEITVYPDGLNIVKGIG